MLINIDCDNIAEFVQEASESDLIKDVLLKGEKTTIFCVAADLEKEGVGVFVKGVPTTIAALVAASLSVDTKDRLFPQKQVIRKLILAQLVSEASVEDMDHVMDIVSKKKK